METHFCLALSCKNQTLNNRSPSCEEHAGAKKQAGGQWGHQVREGKLSNKTQGEEKRRGREGNRWQKEEEDAARLGLEHSKSLEAKPASGDELALIRSRINNKATAISTTFNISPKHTINLFALGRARTTDEHKTAGKMQKSLSHCAGRWSYLVNPVLSSLNYKGKKQPKVSLNIYLLG